MEIVKKTSTKEAKSPGEDRIVMLSDGVFAIAMTLLILDVRLPQGLPHTTFQAALVLLIPNFISYVISFIMISRYWSVHRYIIHSLKRIDTFFIRLNLLLLFFVTTLPIPTSFAIHQPYSDPFNLSIIIYTLSLAMSGFTLTAMWIYATRKHRLVDPGLEQDTINYFLLRLLIAPIMFLLSLLLLLFPIDPNAVYYSWLTIAVVFFLLGRIQPHLFPKLSEGSEQIIESTLTEQLTAHES